MHEPASTGDDHARPDGDVPRVVAGRFRCDRLLKRSHGVATYAGTDLHDESSVIVKLLAGAALSEGARARLEHEGDVLRRLGGTSSGTVTTGSDEGCAYLVQPFVAGVTLESRLADGPLSVVSTLRLATGILTALQQAHDHEVLHRDVKPANVIVAGSEPLGEAVVIDFGFARSAALDPALGDQRVGTARYVAPEAAGLLGHPVDERSDLYSVGAVLYECLAGRPPFVGSDVGEVLRQHLSAAAPSLRELGVAVPRALESIVQRLLRKDPAERYQSAGAVLADVRAVAGALARGEDDPVLVVGLHDRRRTLTEPSFVGRDGELAVLAGAVAATAAGRGGLVLLEAESGGGKSRLLDEVARQAASEAWVLRGQAVDQAAQRPYQLLAGVVRGVVAATAARPGLAEAIRRRLGERVDAVTAALPELTDALGTSGAENLGPEAYGENRTLDALRALVEALGSPRHPVVILLDDCQWADGPTVRLLDRWHDRALRGGSSVLVVAAFRSEEVPADHPLRATAPATIVRLSPLGLADVRSLAESMAGALPEEIVEAVVSLSEGSPFMASAVLRGLVETGALVEGQSGWHVDGDRLAHAQTSRRAALFLLRRIELLAPAALDLLSAGAVLGKTFDRGLAVELCGQDAAAATVALADAGRRRIVWADEATGVVHFAHDKLREALLGRLGPEERRQLHLRAAVRIADMDADRVFELAYHFDAAGQSDAALPYALAAAERARAQHSLDVAAAHYRIAQRGTAVADRQLQARVAEGLGDVLTLQGSYEEATTQLEAALATAATPFERATIEGKLGDVAFRRGDPALARRHLEGAVRQLGRRLPRRSLGFTLSLLVEAVVQAAHTLVPRLFLARRSLESTEREFLAIRLYSRLAYVYWFSSGKSACGWAHLREMNLAERYPPTAELAQAYSEHAPVMTMVPWFSRGIAYAERSYAIRRDRGDAWGQGQSLSFHGVVLYAASRYQESIGKCGEAVHLLEQTGDRWEANTAAWHIAFSHLRLGELDEAVAVARRVHAAAVEIGDQAAAGISLSAWSRASGGKVPAELVAERLHQDTDDAHTATEVRVAEGVRLLEAGELAEARATFEAADAIVRRAGLRQEYVAPVLPWLTTVLRRQAEAVSPYDRRRRSAALRRARRVARRAWRMARSYRNNAPHALRERGLLAALSGRWWWAERLLTRSMAVAGSQGARYEHALTRLAWARAGVNLTPAQAAELGSEAEAEIATLVPDGPPPDDGGDGGPAASLSLADRFAGLLTAGRRIASAATTTEVHAAVREAAVTLLRGEWCEVLDLDVGPDPVPAAADGAAAADPYEVADQAAVAAATAVAGGGGTSRVSRSLVLRALRAGRPVVVADPSVADSADSIVLSGLRSALSCPIMCQGRAVACLYVAHSQVGSLFGPDEVQLTEFIATLAGATLEHVAGTEARLRSLAQNATDVVTIVDREGIITYQSAAVTRVFGFAPSELVGTPLAQWLHQGDGGAILALVGKAALGDEPPQLVECRLRHHDGSWRSVETALNNLFDDPSVNGLVLNSRDISERKRAEKELMEMLEREHQMRQRLQELDRIKTDFVSSVSHELRTPLSSILGYLEMLVDGSAGGLAPDQLRVLDVVDRNARRLLALIEDLLMISAVESGTFKLARRPVSVRALVDGAYQAVVPQLAGRDLHVDLAVADEADALWGDAGQLDRVVINLLTNAVKFTPDGGRISVAARRTEALVTITVSDTGMGIPSEDQPRLFERFFRSSSAQQLAVPGTGLGLSITKTIIEEHGGSIAIRSEAGSGTEVTVTLPAGPVAELVP